jgi:hypothetical protein
MPLSTLFQLYLVLLVEETGVPGESEALTLTFILQLLFDLTILFLI